ncbi:hypothetical protein ACS0TY_034243 [Phlomoides rotata]
MKTMMTLMDRMSSLTTQQAREFLPPLVNYDPNLNVSQSLPQMEDVNYMGRYNGQGGWYNQGKQVQQQGPPQPQVQYNTQGPSQNQGQGRFQNASQQFPGGGSSYNPNARKHENFSYSNPKAAVPFPSGFDPGAKLPNNEVRPSQDDAIEAMCKKMDEYMKSNSNQMKNMEFQIGQLATMVGNMQNKGKFPSTTEPNPKEHCKAIELRSGTKYEGPHLPNEHDEELIILILFHMMILIMNAFLLTVIGI